MSIRIGLDFDTKIDLELLSAGVSIRLVRLFASVQLQARDGWTVAYKAENSPPWPIGYSPQGILLFLPDEGVDPFIPGKKKPVRPLRQ